jgi:hypothetical protein
MPPTIGLYEVLEIIGHGSMGSVYKAFDPLTKQTLAVKTFRLDVKKDSPTHASFMESLHRKARSSAMLRHPGIVTLFDVGEDRGMPYLAMEYVEGETIASVVERGLRFKPEKVVGLVSQIASAIDYAHSRGIVHRDIKLSNLILYDTDRVKVTDFGTAMLDTDASESERLLRTPLYMSPEQAMGRAVDGRSDIFSLGVCAFEMMCGEQPFPGKDAISIVYELAHADPIEPDNLEMSGLVREKWREVFGRVLAKQPDDRYQTATEFAQDLEYCLGAWLGTMGAEVGFASRPEEGGVELGSSAEDEIAPEEAAATAPPLPLHDDVQFTVYRPRSVEPMRWYTLLAFAHLEELPPGSPENELSPADQVRKQAEGVLGDLASAYSHARHDSAVAIPHEAEITFVVEIPGVEVQPARRTFLWLEPVHREEFRLRAGTALDGLVARGRVTVFWGSIVLADVPVAIRVGAQSRATGDGPPERSVARPFRKIFASYSHKDVVVVEEFERYGRTLGDVYLRDVTHLRSGELWDERLFGLIQEADVFQLFWSWNALQSAFVEKEWRYALSLDRPHFVRPTYWEDPLPASPERDLPPDVLRRLHFQLLPSGPGRVGLHPPSPAAPDAQSAPSPSTVSAPAPRRAMPAIPTSRSPAPAPPSGSSSLRSPAPGEDDALLIATGSFPRVSDRRDEPPVAARGTPGGRQGFLPGVAGALLFVVLMSTSVWIVEAPWQRANLPSLAPATVGPTLAPPGTVGPTLAPPATVGPMPAPPATIGPPPAPPAPPAPMTLPPSAPEEVPETVTTINPVPALLEQADQALDAGRLDAAIAAYNEVLKLEPGNREAAVGKLRSLGDRASAGRSFRTAVTMSEGAAPGAEIPGFDGGQVVKSQCECEITYEVSPAIPQQEQPYSVSIFLTNDGKTSIKPQTLAVSVMRNGSPSPRNVALTSREVSPGQRMLVGKLHDKWELGTTSWSLEAAIGARSKTFRAQLIWELKP